MKTMKKFTSINYLHTRMTKSFPPTRPECHLWGKSPETLDIVCFWFYNRTRRTRCIVEHVHRVASRTSPNLFSVFCVCNGHRKRGKKNTKKQRVLIKQQQFLFSIQQLEPALNSDFGEVAWYIFPPESLWLLFHANIHSEFACVQGEIAWSNRTPEIYRILLRFFLLINLYQWFIQHQKQSIQHLQLYDLLTTK